MSTTTRALTLTTGIAAAVLAAPTAAVAQEAPNHNWHAHTETPPWLVKAVGPVVCPNATDKPMLPSAGSRQSGTWNAGVCFGDGTVVHLLRISGHDAPSGWTQIAGAPDGLYYKVTPRG